MLKWQQLRRNLSFRTVATIVGMAICGVLSLQAQTYSVLYNFTGGRDGAFLDAPLTLDRSGNLYGEAVSGGAHSQGTVFRLQRKNSGWIFSPLYAFQGNQDGANPEGGLTIGPDGALYGTTTYGGGLGGSTCLSQGCGTVFSLRPSPTPPRSAFQSWNETVLYRFTGHSDGGEPGCQPTFDHNGNMFCTARIAGSGCTGSGCGTLYELSRSGSSWSFALVHGFTGGNDGYGPQGGVTITAPGSMFGVTEMGGGTACGGYGCGIAYEFSPSGSGWTENVLHSFSDGFGINPCSGVVLDQAGNIYGCTSYTQEGGNTTGIVFELSPSGGSWSYTELYSLSGIGASLAIDSAGNLYGTTSGDGISTFGTVFKLTHSGGVWNYSLLHEFAGGSDGEYPICQVVIDAAGKAYGIADGGGTYGFGLIFEVVQ